MDLTKPVAYRGLALNTITSRTRGPSSGILLERVSYANVQAVGYTEKRSMGDGNDASDVYLSTRRISLGGFIYGKDPGELFDLKQSLMRAFSPTLAYRESPYAYGYLPLTWQEPTLVSTWNADGLVRDLYCNVRPMALPTFEVVRDRQGEGMTAGRGANLAWQVVVEAKDPRIYVMPEKSVEFNLNTGTSGAGSFLNRGDYPAPLQVILNVGTHTGNWYWHFTGGGSQMTIKLPATTTGYVIRYDGYLKVLTLTDNDIEYLRMDLLDFLADKTHPLVAPGTSNWTWQRNTVPGDGGVLLMSVTEEEPSSSVEAHSTEAPPAVTTLAVGDSVFWFNEAFA